MLDRQVFSSLANYNSSTYDKPYESPLIINSCDFSEVIQKLRDFFIKKGYVEVHTQNRLSILAACEDPFTVSTFNYVNEVWPLPQTGQMWLEYELLKNPDVPGYFCVSTSYRNEPNPVKGRHNLIFPMFEFEMKGGMEELIEMEEELLLHLGYDASKFVKGKYLDVATEYNTKELENEHEMRLYEEKTPTFFLTDFPEFTSPFWNMKRNDDITKGTANKIDVILSGQETIGSAERETDKEIMLDRFKKIMDGGYKEKMYELFGEERTMDELEEFLKFNFFKRSGGGIGVTRLIRSMKLEGLMD
jgi:aspartyl/asparaginyl-tRNA synthetase